MGRSRSREHTRRRRSRERGPAAREKELAGTEDIAIRVEAEVQKRVRARTVGQEFEAALQEKLDEEVERHISLITVELEMKKKKLIEDFKQQRETEERTKQELEEILRVNQQRTQEQQHKTAQEQAAQDEALSRERHMLQRTWDQRRKRMAQ
mmetsp:Transcript_83910/g.260736  ORF Transcript_83910/g.260736 Transcript_83910/m.260736 type:complete len:152 (+) Transcript_83910:35-490(+)